MDIANLIIGVGGIVAGSKALAQAFREKSPGSFLSELDQLRREQVAEAMRRGMPAPATAKTYTVRTIDERVRYIRKMIQKGRVHPKVREMAVRSVSRKCGERWCIPERDYSGEVRALFRFTRENVRYVRDAWGTDTFQHPARTLAWGGEDCDGLSVVLASLLQSIGYPVKMRVIRTKNAPDWNHIFLLVGMPPKGPRRWVALDASVDQPPGWHPPRGIIARIRDFPVN